MKILEFIENHKIGILGTLLFHFVFLIGFNYVSVQTRVVKPPMIVMDFSNEEVKPLDLPKPDDATNENQKVEEAESNTGKNEAQSRMLNSAEYNKINSEISEQNRQSVDEQILEDLKSLEQQVIDEQRASGYGYTDSEAEALINSFKEEELKNVETKEAQSEGAFQGTTNITYKLQDRYDTYIYVPVYLCQNGGTVTVNLAVNRSGEVVKAKINSSSLNIKDQCLLDAAIKASYRTRFNRSKTAPQLQKGTITFVFKSQ